MRGREFVVAMTCMWIFSGTNGYLPFLIRDVFDDIFAEQKWAELKWLPAIALGLVCGARPRHVFAYSYLIEWVGQRVIEDLRNDINRSRPAAPDFVLQSNAHRHPRVAGDERRDEE